MVLLHGDRSAELCTASYVGGRVLITASHCFDDRGVELDPVIFAQRTGSVLGDCEVDEDCPSLSIAGVQRPLACRRTDQRGVCYLPEPEFNNQYLEARFAESYPPYEHGQPDVSIAIEYCHIHPAYLQDPDATQHDFAYCILAW